MNQKISIGNTQISEKFHKNPRFQNHRHGFEIPCEFLKIAEELPEDGFRYFILPCSYDKLKKAEMLMKKCYRNMHYSPFALFVLGRRINGKGYCSKDVCGGYEPGFQKNRNHGDQPQGEEAGKKDGKL